MVVPKTGGNTFKGSFYTAAVSEAWSATTTPTS